MANNTSPITQHDCSHLQKKLKQAIVRKQWDQAATAISEYSDCIDTLQQAPYAIPLHDLRQYESENRRMVQQLHLAMKRTRDDIDDLTQTINRLERSKMMVTDSHT